jgi:peptide/nickel transport system permease protein
VATYLLRRLVHSLVVVLIVLCAVFLAAQAIGDPVRLVLPTTASNAAADALRHSLGYDDPLLTQFGRFISHAIRGDFGDSVWIGQDSMSLASADIGNTLILAVGAVFVGFAVGISLGLIASARPQGWIDRLTSASTLVCVSVVDFWVAFILIYVFAVQLRVLPTSGFTGASSLVLPIAVLALRPCGRSAQFVRAAVGEELGKPYIKAALARGIPQARLIRIHALKNVSVPLVTLGGDELVAALSTSVVVGVVFAWPSVGTLLLHAVEHRDLPLVEACVFIFTICIVLINLTVDVSYGFLDRRATTR